MVRLDGTRLDIRLNIQEIDVPTTTILVSSVENMGSMSKSDDWILTGLSLRRRTFTRPAVAPPMHDSTPKPSAECIDAVRSHHHQSRRIALPRTRTQNHTQSTLLLADTDGPAPTASGLAVLSADAQTPVVSQTSVGADLLQTLQILTELAVHAVGQHLVVLAVYNVALSVEEPRGDLVLRRVLDDGDNALEFFRGELAGAVEMVLVWEFRRSVSRGGGECCMYRLLRSTSAFLHTRLEYRRPTPLILVRAYITFSLPSTCAGHC